VSLPPQNDAKDGAALRPQGRRAGRASRWALQALGVAAAALAVVLIDNNFSVWPPSRHAFGVTLDRSMALSNDWLVASPQEQNSALVYMIADMAELSGDPWLKGIVDGFLKSAGQSPSVWHHMVDERLRVQPTPRRDLDQWVEYQRWVAYGSAPRDVPLTESERSNMFSRDKYLWGKRTHQLFALLIYRKRAQDAAVAPLIDHLCAGIAFEANWDFRVTDLYLQRVAFLLAAGRPDLVKRRWVERVLAKQEPDGGWIGSWYGWGPRLFEVSLRKPRPQSHTTVQGMWILYMLKYRYSGWIDQRYG
jgi:hypothetical protein